MKKTTKFMAVLLACVIFCFPVTPIAMDVSIGESEAGITRLDEGYCNQYNKLYWVLESKKEATLNGLDVAIVDKVTLNITAVDGALDESHPEYRIMKDYVADGSYSNAKWVLVDDDFPQNNKLINEIFIDMGISTIGTNAFRGQSSLKKVTIDPSVTCIRSGAFSGCSSIRHIYFNGTKEQWNAINIESDNGILNNGYDALKSAKILKDCCDMGNHVPAEGYQTTDSKHSIVCEYCNKVIGTDDHSFGNEPYETVKKATCTEDGEAVYKCSVCGKTVNRTITKYGHSVDHSTLYYNDEYHYNKCTNDGCDYIENAESHILSEWGPCSTVPGFNESRHCYEDCGYVEYRNTTPILGDVNGDGIVDKNDADILALYISKHITSDDIELSVADVNGDGKINVSDCVKIMLFVNNKIGSLE